MKRFDVFYMLFISTFIILSQTANASCIIFSDGQQILVEEGRCEQRYPACSTFKIAISLMGYDAGILVDETHPQWDFKPGYVAWLARWKQPHNPTTWIAHSCVWYSQLITQRLGKHRFKAYTERLKYGNQDVSGDPGKDNGLTNAWLSSSLTISPREQIQFLNQLVHDELAVSKTAQSWTKRLLRIKTLANGWTLYGKTGSGYQLSVAGKKRPDRQVGWFVGFLTKDKKVITFANLIVDETSKPTRASQRARTLLLKRVETLLVDR